MNVKVYNQEGVEVGTTELNVSVFGIEPNEAVVHQYVVNYLANQRQGNAATKTRREVSGGGRKPWRQKGTGRARAGTSRSPLWRGGGTVFGPHPRSYGGVMPKKMRRLAIRSVLSDKAGAERIRVLDQIKLDHIKTKVMAGVIDKLKLSGKKCLILDEGQNENLVMSCRNMPRIKYCRASLANGYDLLNADCLILTQAGLSKVQEVYG
ncbi:MAG: 50S ribosomal protein L4 [bacterium]